MKVSKASFQTVGGRLVRFTANKHRDVDGLIIDQQGVSFEVKFPPHTARFIMELVAEGATVKLVVDEKHPGIRRRLITIENSGTGEQFDVESVKAPHPPETGPVKRFTIPKPQFTRGGKEGERDHITGVVFGDRFIHLHPDEYEGGGKSLESADVIHVEAKKRTTDSGFVHSDGFSVFHAHSVTIG